MPGSQLGLGSPPRLNGSVLLGGLAWRWGIDSWAWRPSTNHATSVWGGVVVCAALGGVGRGLVPLRDGVCPALEFESLHEHAKASIGSVGGGGGFGCVNGGGARRASRLKTLARDRLLAVACCTRWLGTLESPS